MLQAQVFNNTGGAITPKLTIKHAGSVDNWSSPTTDVNAVSLQSCANNAWTQVSYSFTADASSGNGLLAFIDFQSALNSNSKSVKITELDIRVAPSVQPPELRAVAAELALCQRYFFGITAGGAGVPIGTGMFINVTSCCSGFIGSNWAGGLPLPVSMRVAPTGISFSGGGLFNWSPSFGAARPDFVGLTATWPFPTAPPVADSVLKTLGAAFFYVTGAEL